MLVLKKILDFYIFSNIHVAISGFCITKITLIKFNVLNTLIPLFVAFSILASYNFIRFYEVKAKRLGWFKSWFLKNKIGMLIIFAISVCALVYITFFTFFNLKSLIILFPFAIMTMFYVIPFFKTKSTEISFRYFPAVKIFSIAIAWAGISVLFPLAEAEIKFDSIIYLEFFQRILILIAITIPFDIRDVNSDFKSLKTLPQLFGVKNVKILGTGLLVLFIIFGLWNNFFLKTDVLIAIITGILLWFSSESKNRYYTSFWVESIPIIWLTLILIV
jgi:hypothetical protein